MPRSHLYRCSECAAQTPELEAAAEVLEAAKRMFATSRLVGVSIPGSGPLVRALDDLEGAVRGSSERKPSLGGEACSSNSGGSPTAASIGKTDAAMAQAQGWFHVPGVGVFAAGAGWEAAQTYGDEPDPDYLAEGWQPYAVVGPEGSRTHHYRRPVWAEEADHG